MDLNKLIKESHENAIEKGFYDCPKCDTNKHVNVGCPEEPDIIICPNCNGTGIDQNKNIPELLMLIITEISEAVQALRQNNFSNMKSFNFDIEAGRSFEKTFEWHIKDTFEDEIADAFIWLFDLYGYLTIDKKFTVLPLHFVKENWKNLYFSENTPEELFRITASIFEIENEGFNIQYPLYKLHNLSMKLGIDIEKHIELKMEYNKTRPKKHGKEF